MRASSALLMGALLCGRVSADPLTQGRAEDAWFRQNVGPCTFYVSVPADTTGAATLLRCNFPLLELLYDSGGPSGGRLGPYLPPVFDAASNTLRVAQPRLEVPFAEASGRLVALVDGADIASGVKGADGSVRLHPIGLGPTEELFFRPDGRLERSGSGASLRTYTYGEDGRVAAMEGGGLSIDYTWGSALAAITTGAVTVHLTYAGNDLTAAQDGEAVPTSMRFTWDRGYLAGAFASVGGDPEEEVIRVGYGATAGVVTSVSIDGKTFRFDVSPNVLEISEGANRQRRVTFAGGQWVAQSSPAGTVAAEWNAQRRLAAVTDERGVVRRYDYTALGQQSQVAVVNAGTAAATVVETATYNAMGQVTATASRNLPGVTRAYDAQFRLLGMASTSPTAVTVDNVRTESLSVDPTAERTTTDETVTDLLSGYWVRTVKVVDAQQAVSTVTDRSGRRIVTTIAAESGEKRVVHEHLAGTDFAWVNQ